LLLYRHVFAKCGNDTGEIPACPESKFFFRKRVCRKKAEQLKLPIDPELINYLAQRISSNIRSLEGALIRVASYASLTNRPVDAKKVEGRR
jgi:chromosomal replication initiation ATPase DnaA